MKLSLWDTAGQETYKSVTRSYFRGASGALLVFDLSRRATFDSVTTWLADLRAIAEEDIVVVLVGNKADLISDDDDDGDEESASHDESSPKTPIPKGLARGAQRAVSRAGSTGMVHGTRCDDVRGDLSEERRGRGAGVSRGRRADISERRGRGGTTWGTGGVG